MVGIDLFIPHIGEGLQKFLYKDRFIFSKGKHNIYLKWKNTMQCYTVISVCLKPCLSY